MKRGHQNEGLKRFTTFVEESDNNDIVDRTYFQGNGSYDIFSMRKISYSILLNDDYEGGGLEIRARPFNEVSNEPGTGSFFPSYILHKVDSVISGTRFALVGWVHGQPFS